MILRRLFLQYANCDYPLFNVDADYRLSEGLWSLTGHSGIGKTSFLRLLSGWYSEEEANGVVWKAEVDWDPLGDTDFIGNDPSLLPWKKVAANIHSRVPKASAMDIENIIKATGLGAEVMHARPYELSLGMYKRVEFAAALLGARKILFLDEFFSSLDPDSRTRCFDLVRERRAGKTTIISSHSPEFLPEDGMHSILLRKMDDQPTITRIELVDAS